MLCASAEPVLACAAPGFRTDLQTLAAGGIPEAIASGDLDRDGDVDLVIAHAAGLGVFLGAGGGAFEPQASYDVVSAAAAVAVGDLDADGVLDVVVTPLVGGTPRVLLGLGDGTFGAPLVVAGPGAYAIALGDLDGDGWLDLIASDSSANNAVDVRLGDGAGGFATAVPYATAMVPNGLTLADLNGDAKLDVVVAAQTSHVASVLLGNGDGTLAARVDYPAGLYPRSVAVGDVDGDSILDVAVGNFGGSDVSVLRGLGNGAFAAQVRYPVIGFPTGIAIVDANGDARPEIITANGENGGGSSNSIDVLANAGDGTFGPPTSYPAGAGPSALTIADLDNDDVLDVAVSDRSGAAVSLLFGDRNGTYVAPHRDYTPDASSMVAADLDCDSRQDLVVVSRMWLAVLYGAPGGPRIGPMISLRAEAVAVADIDGDGMKDLIAMLQPIAPTRQDHGQPGNELVVVRGAVDGYDDTTLVRYPTGATPMAISTADLDGDGTLDVVVTNRGDNTVGVFLDVGGTLAPQVAYASGSSPRALALGDVDRDGNADVLVANDGDSNVVLLRGLGDGTLEAAVPVASASAQAAVALVDLDGDEMLDLIVGNSSGAVTVARGNGDGTFAPHASYVVGSQPSAVTVADLDGDEILDLAVADFQDATVTVLRGTGGASFAAYATYRTGNRSLSLALTDLDVDGDLDLAAAGFGGTRILRGRCL